MKRTTPVWRSISYACCVWTLSPNDAITWTAYVKQQLNTQVQPAGQATNTSASCDAPTSKNRFQHPRSCAVNPASQLKERCATDDLLTNKQPQPCFMDLSRDVCALECIWMMVTPQKARLRSGKKHGAHLHARQECRRFTLLNGRKESKAVPEQWSHNQNPVLKWRPPLTNLHLPGF